MQTDTLIDTLVADRQRTAPEIKESIFLQNFAKLFREEIHKLSP